MDTPANCEVCGMIHFLKAEGHSAIEIHYRLCRGCGDEVMSSSSVRVWCGNSGLGSQMCMMRME